MGERIFGFFFFLVLVFISLLDCALLTRSSKEAKASQAERVEEKGQAAGKHIEQTHWEAPPPSARAENKR